MDFVVIFIEQFLLQDLWLRERMIKTAYDMFNSQQTNNIYFFVIQWIQRSRLFIWGQKSCVLPVCVCAFPLLFKVYVNSCPNWTSLMCFLSASMVETSKMQVLTGFLSVEKNKHF